MSPRMVEALESLEAERLAPVPEPPERYPDGPTARLMRQRQLEAEAPDPADEPHAA